MSPTDPNADLFKRMGSLHRLIHQWVDLFCGLEAILREGKPQWVRLQQLFQQIRQTDNEMMGRLFDLNIFNGLRPDALDVMGVNSPSWHDGAAYALALFSDTLNLWVGLRPRPSKTTIREPWELNWRRDDLGLGDAGGVPLAGSLRTTAWDRVLALYSDQSDTDSPSGDTYVGEDMQGWAWLRGHDYYRIQAHLESEFFFAVRQVRLGIALGLRPDDDAHEDEELRTGGAPGSAPPKLSGREKDILVAMLALGAIGPKNLCKRDDAAKKISGHSTGVNLGAQFLRLVRKGYVGSKRGRRGSGVWLTREGLARARALSAERE